MTTSIIRAGGTGVPGVQTTGGDDGALALKVGPLAATVEALSITTAGSVGIGTASPVANLGLVGGTSNATNLSTAYSTAAFNITPKSTSGYSLAFGSGPSDFPYIQMSAGGSSAHAMSIQPYGGMLGVGTTVPAYTLDVTGTGRFTDSVRILTGATNTSGLILGGDATAGNTWTIARDNVSTGDLKFISGTSERMRITSAGLALVNKSTKQTANAPLQIASSLGTGQIFVGNTSGTGWMFGRDNVSTGNFVLGEVTNDADTSVSNLLTITTGTGFVGIGMTPVASYGKLQVGSAVTSAVGVGGLQAFISGTNSAVGQSGNMFIVTTDGQAANIGGSIGFGGKYVASGASGTFATIAGRKENGTDNNGAGYLQFNTEPNGGTPTERVRITSTGLVGINTASPASLLEVKASALNRANGISLRGSGANDVLYIYPSSDNVATIEHLIDGSTSTGGVLAINPQGGNVGICNPGSGVVSGYLFNTGGFLQHSRASGSAMSMTGFYNGGSLVGEIRTSTTATAYITSSDYRLKEDVSPMTSALAKVAQLKPCTYKWKSNGEASQGFIAHELQEVVPEAVAGVKDELDEDGKPKYQGVDTSFLVATLTAAIQEQQATIEALTARITALEG